MSYTPPTTRSTGDFITASIWNTDMVNNIIYLKAQADRKVYTAKLCGLDLLTTAARDYVRIPAFMNGWKLTLVAAMVKAASSSGIPTFTVKDGTTSMLTTNITIDQGEYDTMTAAVPAVIDGTHNTVATGDQIETACSVSGTGVTFAQVELTFTPT